MGFCNRRLYADGTFLSWFVIFGRCYTPQLLFYFLKKLCASAYFSVVSSFVACISPAATDDFKVALRGPQNGITQPRCNYVHPLPSGAIMMLNIIWA
jgi:hypothetical protein